MRRVLVALVLSVGALVPATTASAQSVDGVTFAISPTTGPPGTVVTFFVTGCADTNGHTLGEDGTIWPYKKGTSSGSTRFGFDVTHEGTWTGSAAFTMAGTGGPDEPVTPGEYTFDLICTSIASGEEVSILRDFTVTVSAPKSAPAVVRDNTWFLRNTNTAGTAQLSFVYGRPDDFPLFGDWDGNGTDGPGVVRDDTWFLRNSNTSGPADVSFVYGRSTDFPISGRWVAGSATDTVGVVRDNAWFLRNSNTSGPADVSFLYGRADDFPIVGDWNGDGIDTPGVVRGNTWFLRNTNTEGPADVVFAYGTSIDFPIVGDWDGNGTDTPGVVRDNVRYLRNSNTAGVADIGPFTYGRASDFPMAWSGAPG